METAEDIVRKMRETVSIIADKESEGSDILSVWSILSTFADRIENAHNRYKDDNLIGYPHSFCTLGNEVKAMETVEDIVKEMREWPSAIDKSDAEYLAYRIENAAEAECDQCKLLAEDVELIKALKEENERLKSALKPVLDFHVTREFNPSKWIEQLVSAVIEAKRIYREGVAE